MTALFLTRTAAPRTSAQSLSTHWAQSELGGPATRFWGPKGWLIVHYNRINRKAWGVPKDLGCFLFVVSAVF